MAENRGGGLLAGMLKRAVLTGVGVALGSYWLDGIHYADYTALALVVLALGIFSAVLRPLLALLALPFVLLTLGLGLLVINALLYLLAAQVVDGFYVEGFWSAFFGALIISILNALFSRWIDGGPPRRRRVVVHRSDGLSRRARRIRRDDDVIDI